MAAVTKRKTKLHIRLTNSDQATAHGGQVLIDALCRRFGLWQRVQQESSLDPRKRTGAGFAPAAPLKAGPSPPRPVGIPLLRLALRHLFASATLRAPEARSRPHPYQDTS